MVTPFPPLLVRYCDLSELVQQALTRLTPDQARRFAPWRAPAVVGYWDVSGLQLAFEHLFDLALHQVGLAPVGAIQLALVPAEETVSFVLGLPGVIASAEVLAPIKHLVEAHGGSLAAREQPQFVTYDLRLPLDTRTVNSQPSPLV